MLEERDSWSFTKVLFSEQQAGATLSLLMIQTVSVSALIRTFVTGLTMNRRTGFWVPYRLLALD